MRLTSKSTKFKPLQSQLHRFLIKLITRMPYIITHVRDTYCACGVYVGVIDEFLTWENSAIPGTTVCFTHITILWLDMKVCVTISPDILNNNILI